MEFSSALSGMGLFPQKREVGVEKRHVTIHLNSIALTWIRRINGTG